MPAPAKGRTATFEPAGLEPATEVRPDVRVRIELLRIVWRPDRDAATAIKACAELEKYVSGGRQVETPG